MNYIKTVRRKGLKDLFALFVAILMVIWMTPIGISSAAISTYSNTLSSSSPGGTAVTYTFVFTPSTTTKIDTVLVKFCQESGGYYDTCTAITETQAMAFSNSSSTIDQFGDGSNTLNAITFDSGNNILTVDITGSASDVVEPHTMVTKNWTNPSAQVMYARLATFDDDTPAVEDLIDDGSIGTVIISDVEITGTQPELLTVTVAGNATETSTDCEASSLDSLVGLSATSVPFGYFKSSVSSTTGSQSVAVATNSSAGYTIKALTDQLMTSGANTIPGPTGLTTGNWVESTSYGFGICSADGTGSGLGTFTEIYENPTTLRTLYTYGSAADLEYTYVYFKVAVQGSQEPGDYTTTMNYVVTPMY